MDGTQFPTAMLAIVFAAAILVSSQLFVGYCSAKNTASTAMIVADTASAPRTGNAVWTRKAHVR